MAATVKLSIPVYCIRPLHANGGDDAYKCLSWLESQPIQNVVFLYFGSLGLFSIDQQDGKKKPNPMGKTENRLKRGG